MIFHLRFWILIEKCSLCEWALIGATMDFFQLFFICYMDVFDTDSLYIALHIKGH